MHSDRNTLLFENLKSSDVVGEQDLTRAFEVSGASRRTLEDVLIELGIIPEERLTQHIANWLVIEKLQLTECTPDIESATLLGGDFLLQNRIFPIVRDGVEQAVICADPRAIEVLNTIEFQLEKPVNASACDSTTIIALCESVFRTKDLNAPADTTNQIDLENLRSSANQGPIIRQVQDILSHAVDKKASDIHFEDQQHATVVRFRIDGILVPQQELPLSEGRACQSRLKVMADLNISAARLPQDGRFQSNVRGRKLDVRMSVLPTQFGESIALRVLDRSRLQLTWEALGFQSDRIEEITQILNQPNGIFLVTGPTGSGKTTTLNTALSQMDLHNRKAISIEDPIEYTINGVSQVAVNSEVGMSFATALRSVLRQDPDVVLIGEIRDQETAENAVRAALMGRLVLSTVHTNSAAEAVTRLRDLSIPDFLLSATLRGILSQRLLRKCCGSCNGECCSSCNNTGYQGRIVASELLSITPEVRTQIADGVPANQIHANLTAHGSSLENDAQRLVENDRTNASEVFRVLGNDT